MTLNPGVDLRPTSRRNRRQEDLCGIEKRFLASKPEPRDVKSTRSCVTTLRFSSLIREASKVAKPKRSAHRMVSAAVFF